MGKRFGIVLLAAALSGGAIAAPKAAKTPAPPADFQRLIACKSIADNVQRLSCYDREVGVVGTASARGELVVMNREEIRKTRRSLFGLSLPDLSVFGGGNLPGDADILETTIKYTRQGPDGK